MSATSDAMRALLEAVKSGKLPEPIFHGSSIVSGHWAYVTGLDYMQRKWAFKAYNGSLEAAKALHDAVLPDRPCAVYFGYEYGATVMFSPTWDDGRISASNTIPARAWLIAILEALIAKETE